MSKNITVIAWRDLWHPESGGAEIYLTNIMEYLAKGGFNITFLTPSYPNAKNNETKNGITYIRIGNWLSIYILLPIYFLLNLRSSTDLIIESYNFLPFWTPFFHKNRLLIVYHIQTVEWLVHFGKLLGGLSAKFITTIFPVIYRNEHIVTISQSSKQEILDYGFKPKSLDIVYSGTDLPISQNTKKQSQVINIVCIGRLKNTKNNADAIRLIHHAVRKLRIKNIKLYIAGKGEDEENLKKLAERLQLNNYIDFLGYISDQNKINILGKSHLHLQLAKKEGWGITIIEAATQATPTLCHDVPGLRDSVRPETGYLVKEDQDIHKIWEKALKDITTQNLSYTNKQKNCLKWAKNFGWEKQKQAFYNIVSRTFFS